MEKQKKLSGCAKNAFGLPGYSFSEELFNSITHGLGIIFAFVAFFILIPKYKNDFWNLFSVVAYLVTLFVLYTGSTLYHSVNNPKAKSYLRKFDHCSIFLLIAGTYTPICTVFIKGPAGKIVLGAVWFLAILGIILNMIDVNKFSKFSLTCYILMGWSVVFIAKPAMNSLLSSQLWWLLIGGVFYTVGAVLYVLGKKIKYMHSVWHLFVLAGSVCHFMILV